MRTPFVMAVRAPPVRTHAAQDSVWDAGGEQAAELQWIDLPEEGRRTGRSERVASPVVEILPVEEDADLDAVPRPHGLKTKKSPASAA